MLLPVPFRVGILIIICTKYYSEVESDVQIAGMAGPTAKCPLRTINDRLRRNQLINVDETIIEIPDKSSRTNTT